MEQVEAIIAALLLAASPAFAQRVEPVPFGDFEQWTRREIKESGILGGNVRTVYVIGPEETIVGNKVYDYSRTIWASSNAYARVAGITKTSVTVEPAQGPDGLCARLTTRFAECKVAGVVNISVLATGSIYWGRMLEPVTGVKDPFSMMDWGIPFTGKPSALLLDISAQLPNTGKLVRGTTFSHKEFPYSEEEQANFYESCFRSVWEEPWFGGMFWWDWYTKLPEQQPETGFSIAGKKAEEVVKAWYGQH